MFKYADKEVLKYLITLMVTVLAGTLFFLFVQSYFLQKERDLEERVFVFDRAISSLQSISNHIISTKSLLFETTAATDSTKQREKLNKEIQEEIEAITSLQKLTQQYTKSITRKKEESLPSLKKITPLLKELLEKKEELQKLLNKRDMYISQKDTISLSLVAKQIRSYNRKIPHEFEELLFHVTKAKDAVKSAKESFQKTIKKHKRRYITIEMILLGVGVLLTLWFLRLISIRTINLYKHLEVQLYKDSLTGLYSRVALQKNAEQSSNLALIIIDIDAFKNINELYGVQVGNIVLQELAKYLQKFQSQSEFSLYRIASDEFIYLYEDSIKENSLLQRELENLSEYLSDHRIWINDTIGYVQLEFNLAGTICKQCADNPMGRVDMALNYAKEKNLPYAIYSEKIDKKVELRQNILWKKAIKKGIEDDDFVPFFQKIVDKEGRVIKYETLMRLRQTKEEEDLYIAPFKYLEIAKKTRFYLKISSLVIEKSLEACKKEGVNISINLSVQDMQSQKLKKMLKESISQNSIANRVIFEIVESESVVGNERIKEFVKEFRAMGVRFAIDDFGSGFSNFSFILALKPEFLKIDGSLIKNITEDSHSYELVKSIVAFAKALKITTVAEFVHSKEVFQTVVDLEVDEFQGYYFHEPSRQIVS